MGSGRIVQFVQQRNASLLTLLTAVKAEEQLVKVVYLLQTHFGPFKQHNDTIYQPSIASLCHAFPSKLDYSWLHLLRATYLLGLYNYSTNAHLWYMHVHVHPEEWHLHLEVLPYIWKMFNRAQLGSLWKAKSTYCWLWLSLAGLPYHSRDLAYWMVEIITVVWSWARRQDCFLGYLRTFLSSFPVVWLQQYPIHLSIEFWGQSCTL